MGVAVQFWGIKSVVRAYENMQCAAWSMLQGKQFLFKYEGDDLAQGGQELEQLLQSVEGHSSTEAIYTLRVYDETSLQRSKTGPNKGKAKIYIDTPFDGSFNFRLTEGDERSEAGRGGYRVLSDRMDKMEELIKAAIAKRNDQDDQDDTEEMGGLAGVVKQLTDMPEIKAAIAGKVVQLMDRFLGNGPVQPLARIAGPDANAEAPAAPAPAANVHSINVQKLNSALVVLAQIDPNLADNLTKLAELAKRDPAQYHGLVAMLQKL